MRKTNTSFMLKNKCIIAILVLLLSINYSYSQFSVKIINENFNNNAMQWDVKDDNNCKMDISEGKYILSNKMDGTALTSTIEALHLQDVNYRISAVFSKIKGIDNNGFGLIWGGLDGNNEFEFVISSNGFFKILKWKDGFKETIVDWSYQASINKWDLTKNTLKIECLKNVSKFYINDTYVFACKSQLPFGNKVGFVMNETMSVEIDELIVENLTIINDVKYPSDIQYVKINKSEFKDSNQNGTLENNENAELSLEITNEGPQIINDLALNVLPHDLPNGLVYSPVTMIDNIQPGETKLVKIQLSAFDDITNQTIPLTLKLTDISQNTIDSQILNLQTKLEPVITNSNTDSPVYDPGTTNSGSESNDELGACATGCLISVLAGILSAIFE